MKASAEYTHAVRSKEDKQVLDRAESLEEAQCMLAELEARDKWWGDYTPDTYEIYDLIKEEVFSMKQHLIEAILDLRPEDQSVEELLPTLEGKTDEELLKDLLTSAKWYKSALAVHKARHFGLAYGMPTGAMQMRHTEGVINPLPDAVRWGYEPEKPQSNEE